MANPQALERGVTPTPSARTEASVARRWRDIASRYHTDRTWQGVMQLVITLLPFFGLLVGMYWSLHVSYFLTLAIAPIAAGFLLRTFVLMHDCAHGSFVPSKRANDIIGSVTGVLSLTPFGVWRRDHALHHASSGDLDRRGHGDIYTLTIREYQALSRWSKIKYRLYRNPVILFGLGPIYLMVSSRKKPTGPSAGAHGVASARMTNLAIVALILTLGYFFGFAALALVYFPVFLMAGSAGIWLFYVQHQFEETYWEPHEEWDYGAAAMRGSSYYKLPKVLEWMTGHIGLHHVHHFDPRVPSYNLGKCYVENEEFRCATVLTIRESLHSASLKLWDEDTGKMVGYREARSVAAK